MQDIDYSKMEQNALEAAEFLKIMANPARLLMLCRLAKTGEMSAGEIVAAAGLSQSATSQHLSLMREAQLIATQRKGNEITYSIKDNRVLAFMTAMYGLFCETEGTTNA